jgi:hypothetical protein
MTIFPVFIWSVSAALRDENLTNSKKITFFYHLSQLGDGFTRLVVECAYWNQYGYLCPVIIYVFSMPRTHSTRGLVYSFDFTSLRT